MITEIFIPKASMSMAEGTVIRWLKSEGDSIEQGEGVVEIETDKTLMEVEANASGTLLKIIHESGVFPVTTVIGYIGEPGDIIPKAPDADIPSGIQPPVTGFSVSPGATPKAKTLAALYGISLENVRASSNDGYIRARDIEGAKAAPPAKAIAKDAGLLTGDITGAGFAGNAAADSARERFNTETAAGTKPSAMRKAIAARMTQSHLNAPHVTVDMAANVTRLLQVRAELNDAGNSFTINDFILRAVILVMCEMPQLNWHWIDGLIHKNAEINLGVAIALEDGLIVPVIRNAGVLTFREISDAARLLGDKAKNGGLTPDEYTGSTFTVSNLGMFGVRSFTPILNPPESGILGVNAIVKRFACVNGKGVWIDEMNLSLTFDHRVLDGVTAARWLNALIHKLERPALILL